MADNTKETTNKTPKKQDTMTKEQKREMRKTNMRIFTTYKKIAWDYLFYYTIDFLFLTQVKNIKSADVVLKNTFNSIFRSVMQIPGNIIVEFLGRKNSLIFANILNCLYMVIIMLSRNLRDLIFAEFIGAIAFSIKNIVEPSLLSESIPPSRHKRKIYSKINAEGASGYYLYNAISKIIGGFLFMVNGYIPIVCSLLVLIFVVILSACFIEPVQRKKKNINQLLEKKQLQDIKGGFKYTLESERLKALILCASLIGSIITILTSYYVSILQELDIPAIVITIVAAFGSFVSAYSSKKQEGFQRLRKNKSLITIAQTLSITCFFAGVCGLGANKSIILFLLVIVMSLIFNFCQGIYYTSMDKFLKSFSNKKIDTKIFAAKDMVANVAKAVGGICAAFLLSKTTTAISMIIVGIVFTIIYMWLEKYMEARVGLKPEEYSEEETKYDEMKEILNKGK